MTGIVWLLLAALIVGVLAAVRRAGKDSVAKENLDAVVDANKPTTPAELDGVRKRYRRD